MYDQGRICGVATILIFYDFCRFSKGFSKNYSPSTCFSVVETHTNVVQVNPNLRAEIGEFLHLYLYNEQIIIS